MDVIKINRAMRTIVFFVMIGFMLSCEKFYDDSKSDTFDVYIDGKKYNTKAQSRWSEDINPDSMYTKYDLTIFADQFSLDLTEFGQYFPYLQTYPDAYTGEFEIYNGLDSIDSHGRFFNYASGEFNVTGIDDRTYSNAMIIEGNFDIIATREPNVWLNTRDTMHIRTDYFKIHATKSYAKYD